MEQVEIDRTKYTVVLFNHDEDDLYRVLKAVNTYNEALAYMDKHYHHDIDLLHNGRWSSWSLEGYKS